MQEWLILGIFTKHPLEVGKNISKIKKLLAQKMSHDHNLHACIEQGRA